jgi:predicted TIM-barrel fold metal-dependent hydrolase
LIVMPRTEELGVPFDRLPLIDVHTHTSGEGADGPPGAVVRCLEECGVEQAFLFAPLLQPHGLQLTDEHLDDVRRHNDYIAHFCAASPDRLLAFAVLNPNPGLSGGDLEGAVQLMVEEARRCYHELGIRGVKMVPDRWSVDDPRVLPLMNELAELGMYAAFHCGIFLDERSSTYCRPALYEGLHLIEGFHGHLAHLGWPWVDECIATLAMETFHAGPDSKDRWQLKADLSFGSPPDWQLESMCKAINMLPADVLMYASDCFWPCEPTRYLEEFVYPQLATIEAAATLSRTAPPAGSSERVEFRRKIFHHNALAHWETATRGRPQELHRQRSTPRTPRARNPRTAQQQVMRSPGINQPRQTMG